ncbi:MAG: peptidoglycan-binding protein [Lachnospiraceae bacterium]|nr:peptidoglycan-binding protein [Lachnospiraceae bacterium]
MNMIKTLKKVFGITAVLSLCFCFSTIVAKDAKAAGTAEDVLAVAAAEIGYHEKATESQLDDKAANPGSANYTKYARDLGFANGQPWCAFFIYWCMKNAGVNSNAYPNVGYTNPYWFSARGLWYERGTYIPKPGDYVVLGGPNQHCGIVESATETTLNTIEGNTSDVCARKTYNMSSTYIIGFGVIDYAQSGTAATSTQTVAPSSTSSTDTTTTTPEPIVLTNTDKTTNPGSPYPIPTVSLEKGSQGDEVKWVQQYLNACEGCSLEVDGDFGNLTLKAVKDFQTKNNMDADGVCGSATISLMLDNWQKASSTTTNKKTNSKKQAIIDKLISKLANSTAESVVTYYLNDFDNDGSKELFVITKNDSVEGCNHLWFVSDNEVNCIMDENFAAYYENSKPICKVASGVKLFKMEFGTYGSGSVSKCYYVSNGTVAEVNQSLEGLTQLSGVAFTIHPSAYDAVKSADGVTAGHTYKPYYVKWEGDKFKQYNSKEISTKQFSNYIGAKAVMNKIKAAGYNLDNIIYRSNHTININVSKVNKKGNTDYENVTLTQSGNKVKVVKSKKSGKNIVAQSTYGGIYKLKVSIKKNN